MTPTQEVTLDPTYRYRAQVERVIDGDTFRARVDLGFYCSVTISVRVRGVNTPEHNEIGGNLATAWVRELIDGKTVLLQSYHDRRSFERWVCDCWLVDEAGENLAEAIINSGYGKAV